MMGWQLKGILVVVAIGAIAIGGRYELYQYHLHQMRERYPFKAYLHGEPLITEDGSPLRFATAAAAHRYEQEYDKP